MKSNLSVSTTASYQDPGLKLEETPFLLDSPDESEMVDESPLLGGEGLSPAPIELPAAPKIDDSSFLIIGGKDDSQNTSVGASQSGEVEQERAGSESSNSVAATGSGDGEVTGTIETTAQSQSQTGSFIGDNWYYFLAAGALVVWALSKMLSRGPSFESPKDEPFELDRKVIGDNPRGQFKKAKRFMKPGDKVSEDEEPLGDAAGEVEEVDLAKPTGDNPRGQFKKAKRFMRPGDKVSEDEEPLGNAVSEVEEVDLANPAGDSPRGQFKKTERFMNPGDKVPEQEEPPGNVFATRGKETDLTELDVLEGKTTKQSRANTMPIDQSADDDFDFDLSEGGLEIDDDEFVAFDDQDSQLSLADSDTEFGFDLDDEEPDGLLGSGKQTLETLAENAESIEKSSGDLGIADTVDRTKDAVSGVAEGAQAGIAGAAAAAGTAAAGVAAAGAAAKGGFFSRLFGSKKKKSSDDVVDSSLDESEVVADVPSLVDEPMELGDGSGVDDSDFDFDLEEDGDALAVEADGGEGVGLSSDEIDSEDSGEFSFDLEDSDEDISVGNLANMIDEPTAAEEVAVGLEEGDSAEIAFDLGDSDDEVAVSSMETLVDESVSEVSPVAEEEVVEVEEVAAELEEGDSAEFAFGLDDSDEEVSISAMDTLVDNSVVEASAAVEEEAARGGDSEESDSSEFGFGLFDDDVSDKKSVEVASENTNDDSESGVVAPVVAAASAAVGAGLAGIGLAGASSVDTAEADRQWETKLNALEDQNAKLSSQVTKLTNQLEETTKSGAQAESLQQEHDALTETVKSLGLEKDELLKEKELADKEKSRLAEELEAAEKRNSAWEQEKVCSSNRKSCGLRKKRWIRSWRHWHPLTRHLNSSEQNLNPRLKLCRPS